MKPVPVASSGPPRAESAPSPQHSSSPQSDSSRLTPADLVGARIEAVREDREVLAFALTVPDGREFFLAIMRDPEGNGPGSLHVFDRGGKFLCTLGGR